MSTKLPTLCCAAVLIVSMIQWTTAIDVIKKMTCLNNGDANKKDWKTCERGTNAEHPSYLYPGLDIPRSLSNSALPAMKIPVNSFRCFTVQRYAEVKSLKVQTCPALCKLRDTKPKKFYEGLLYTTFLDSHGISVAKSPRYGSGNYFRSEICIYNISMPCKDSYIKISEEGSDIDIAEGDSVEIIDYKKHNVYQSITGSDKSLLQNIPIHTSDFLVLFLSERDSTQGAGFKLQFECPVIINKDNDNDNDGSGSGSGF